MAPDAHADPRASSVQDARSAVLLTGATGYVGGRLLRRLETDTRHHVRCLRRDGSRLRHRGCVPHAADAIDNRLRGPHNPVRRDRPRSARPGAHGWPACWPYRKPVVAALRALPEGVNEARSVLAAQDWKLVGVLALLRPLRTLCCGSRLTRTDGLRRLLSSTCGYLLYMIVARSTMQHRIRGKVGGTEAS